MFPKLDAPLFSVTIPSTKKQIKLRPMRVKEEKILLMAKESQDANAIMLAVKQVVQNCLATEKIDVNHLTLFDIDYLFIQIRANSIDPTIKISLSDANPAEHLVNLNDVIVKFPDGIHKTIAVTKDTAVTLKYPEAKLYESDAISNATTGEAIIEELIFNCFESYVDHEKVYKFADATRAEATEFIDSLPIEVYNKVFEFFSNIPHVFYEIKYKDLEDKDQTLELTKLNDFFTF